VSDRTVRVALGAASYDVFLGIGLLERLPDILAASCPAPRYALIADRAVAAHYGTRVRQLADRVARCDLFTFPPGESSKSREEWARLSNALLESGLGRDGAILALGGGVCGDLAGFVAATYMRGIPYVQVPTSVVAMIDSSIGGKTGIDTAHGKNLIGAFHQPRAVVADVTTLETLDPAHLRAGLAEALKHGAVADRDYFDRIVRDAAALTRREPETWRDVVARSVEIKAAVVSEDEREQGRRATLNFGHTVAHAVEAVTRYATLHGEAVAVGMAIEARLGESLGVTRSGAASAISSGLAALGLPRGAPSGRRDALLGAMQRDKKVRDATVRFALLADLGAAARGPGGEWTFEVPADTIRDHLPA
jgi:3-dehydroquinate synthase